MVPIDRARTARAMGSASIRSHRSGLEGIVWAVHGLEVPVMARSQLLLHPHTASPPLPLPPPPPDERPGHGQARQDQRRNHHSGCHAWRHVLPRCALLLCLPDLK
ncbi:hypothetical protein ZWY2020_040325 [Hordeum vulgare]|nr:hypothetical protein ZWY2020_040325 [Hordeum vulgare]